jgi:hypothetical protein
MSQTPTIIGQNKPDAGVLTTLLSLAASEQAQFSVFVCNQGSEVDEITISLLRATQAETDATYIAYDTPMIGNSVLAFAGLFLNSGDQVKIISKNGTSSFNATGMIYT